MASTMRDTAAAFLGGFEAMERHKEGKARRKALDEEMEMRKADFEMRKKRFEAELELERQTQRDEAARYVEAEAAWQKFSDAHSAIDWGNPASVTQYQKVVGQYLPTMLKHESTAKKFEGLNKAITGGIQFTARKIAEIGAGRALSEAAEIAPELALDPPKRADGSIDTEAFTARLNERREKLETQAKELMELRREPVKKPVTKMGAGSKAELDAYADELREVNKNILEMDRTGMRSKNPDSYLALVNRKSSLLDKLRAFDAKFAAESDVADEPAEKPAPAVAEDGQVDFIWDPRAGKLITPTK